jgi:hypothetical protein
MFESANAVSSELLLSWKVVVLTRRVRLREIVRVFACISVLAPSMVSKEVAHSRLSWFRF